MKKEIVPKDSRYIPFVQQKSCCVPACISMVMYKNKIPLLPQELLGYHLGLIVAQKNRKLFWNARTGKKPPAGYGTRIYKKEFHPNAVFRKLKIPLKMTFHPISSFNGLSFVNFLVDSSKNNRDILVCFDHGVLKGSKEHGGHVCVFDRIYPKQGIVRLVDPQTTIPKWRIVKINRLRKAVEFHGDSKSGGFWEFKVTKKS